MNFRTFTCLCMAALALAPLPPARSAEPKPVVTNEVRIQPGETNADAILRDALRRAMNPPTNNTGAAPSIPMSAPTITNRPVRPSAPLFNPAGTNAPAAAVPTIRPAMPAVPAATTATPGLPAATPAATVPAARISSLAEGINKDEPVDMNVLQFQVMPLEQFLEFYSKVIGKTLLRPATLPASTITVKVVNPLTRGEVAQMLDHVLALNGVTTIPVGDKFVTVVPAAQGIQEGGRISKAEAKDLPEAAQFMTQIVQLKYVPTAEIVKIIQPFAKTPSAIISVDANGVLVIRDYAINVKRMMELIEKVDVASGQDITQKLIPIKYALAADIANVLGSLTGAGGYTPSAPRQTGIQGTPSGTSVRRAGGSTSGTFGQPGGFGAGGNTGYNPSGFGGAQPGFGAAGASSLNTGALGAPGGTASAFQNRLTQIVTRASQGGIQLLGEVKIIPDERTNSILVFATRADMDIIEDIIEKLDVVLAQVLIEALILDVTLGDNFNISVSAGQTPTGNKTKVGGVANNGNGSLTTGNNFLNQVLQSVTTNGISNLVSAFPAGSGINYFGSLSAGIDFAFSAVADDSNIKVLARPRIQTSHAVPAAIFVGETRPYVTGTSFNTFGGSGSQSQYQQTQIGITLNVLPLINQEGLVVMDIQQQAQQVGGSVIIDGNSVPVTQDQSASAKVAVRDKETIVLGGFIRDSKDDSKSGVPFLKDIPLLGYFFRTTDKKSSRRELLVMIRPTVLPTPEAAALKATEMRRELPAIRMSERDILESERKLQKRADDHEKQNPPKK